MTKDHIDEILVKLFFSDNQAWVVATNLRTQVRDLNQELERHATDRANQRKELEALRKDKARLDWLDAHRLWIDEYPIRGESLRIAIDASMECFEDNDEERERDYPERAE